MQTNGYHGGLSGGLAAVGLYLYLISPSFSPLPFQDVGEELKNIC